MIEEVSQSNLEVLLDGVSQTNLSGYRYVPDTLKIETSLGFRNHYNLRESISRTIQWNRETLI